MKCQNKPDIIDIRDIDRDVLRHLLPYGSRRTIKERLEARGVYMSEKTFYKVFYENTPITPLKLEAVKEAVDYLNEMGLGNLYTKADPWLKNLLIKKNNGLLKPCRISELNDLDR